MRPLLTLLVGLAISPVRAELNTEGLPAGAAGIIGLDLTLSRKTKLGHAIEKLVSAKAEAGMKFASKLNQELGIDIARDLSGVVFATYQIEDFIDLENGSVIDFSKESMPGIALIRGKFLPATIDAFGKNHGIASRKVGQRQAWEAAPFMAALLKVEADNDAKKAYILAYSEKLLVIAGPEFLERALASVDRRERSALLPASVKAKFETTPNAWLYLYADAEKLMHTGDVRLGGAGKQAEKFGLQDLVLTVDGNAHDHRLVASADFRSPAKAETFRENLAEFLPAFTANPHNDVPQPFSDFLRSLRVGGEGKKVTLETTSPRPPR